MPELTSPNKMPMAVGGIGLGQTGDIVAADDSR
jgi:hypothetical protein